MRAERARRGDLRQVHAQIRRAADADADDRRRAGLAAGVEHAVDDEGLDRVDAVGGNRHLEPGIVLRAAALRESSRSRVSVDGVGEIDVDHRHADAAGRVLVACASADARSTSAADTRASRARSRGGSPPSARRRRPSTPRPIVDVVDRDAGVLAQQVVGRFGDRDVADHRAEHALARSAPVSRAASAAKPCLMSGGRIFSARM